MTERPVDRDPEVLEGEDEIPREPPQTLDPYTPEPGGRPREARAFLVARWAWIPIAVVIALVVYAIVR